jgi:hypothetical protein
LEHAHELSINVRCEKGDLIVGFLRSYDERMGVVEVTATTAQMADESVKSGSSFPVSKKTILVDSWRPQVHESVFATAILQGLNAGNGDPAFSSSSSSSAFSDWRVSIRPIARLPTAHAKSGTRALQQQQMVTANTSKATSAKLSRRSRRRLMEVPKDLSMCQRDKFKLMLVACT